MATEKTLRLGIDARGAAVGAAQFGAATKQVQAHAHSAAVSVEGFRSGLSMMMMMMATMATAAGVVGAIRVLAGFEERIIVVGKVAGATAKEFELLSAKAKELGASTRFTAEQVAEGELALARAGFSVTETMQAISTTLDLATAAEIDLGEASQFVANSIRQFGLEASEAGRVADAFTVAANNSNTTVQQLAQALTYGGTVAATMGLSIERAAAIIGVLGNRGIQASKAGTNLRGVLLALTDPTEKVTKALERLGLTYDEVNPATNDFQDVLDTLGDRISRLPNVLDAAGIANQIFGRRNAAAAVTMATSSDEIERLTNLAIESKAAHEDLARALENTIIGKFNAMKSAAQGLVLEVGDGGVTGAIKAMLETVTGSMRILGGMEGSFDDATFAARALAIAITALTVRIAIFAAIKVGGMLSNLASGLSLASIAAGGLAAPIALATGAIVIFGMEMAASARKSAEFARSSKDVADAIKFISRPQYDISRALGGEAGNRAMKNRIKQLQMFIAATKEGSGMTGPTPAEGLFPGIQEEANLGKLGILDTPVKNLQTSRGRATTSKFFETSGLVEKAQAEIAALEKLTSVTDAKAKADKDAFDAAILWLGTFDDITSKMAEQNRILGILGTTAKETATLQDVAQAQSQAAAKKGKALTDEDADAIRRLVLERNSLIAAIDEQTAADVRAATASAEAAAKLVAHSEGVASLRKELETRLEVGAALADGDNRGAKMIEFRSQMQSRGIILFDSEAVALEDLYNRVLDLADARRVEGKENAQTIDRTESGIRSIEREIEQRKFLIENVGLNAEAYTKAKDRSDILIQSESLLANANGEQAKKILEARDALLEFVDATYEASQKRELIQEFQNGFVDLWSDIITGSMSAADAFEAFASRMLAAMTEIILKRALMNAFFPSGGGGGGGGNGSLGSGAPLIGGGTVDSRGSWFDGGGRRFARGEVLNKITPISYVGGRGVAGESGPEAILPLSRDSKGNLGVKSAGGGQTVNPQISVTIVTKDYDSFRKSRSQVREDFRRMGKSGKDKWHFTKSNFRPT